MLQLTRWQVWNPLEKPPNYRGKYGEHYTDKTGPHKKPATLIDAPHMNPAFNSSQIFETAALTFEGKQTGTMYGSVQWGWTRYKSGSFKQLDLVVRKMGIPSETFRRAVEIWNSSKTPSGEPDFEIPGMSALQPTSGTEAKEVESALHT